jgi:uncharacterized membrane protein
LGKIIYDGIFLACVGHSPIHRILEEAMTFLLLLLGVYLGGLGIAAGVGTAVTDDWKETLLFALTWPFVAVLYIWFSLFDRPG